MTATADQIARLRRMVAEPTTTTYSDATLQEYIERYPLLDANNTDPTYLDYATTPPTPTEDPDWIPTYDLAQAAADIWLEKAAALATKFDFSADGGSYNRNQAYNAAMKSASYWRSRRSMRSIPLMKSPKEGIDDL